MRALSVSLAGLIAVGVSACGGVEGGDGPLGAARQAQVDPGWKDYVIYQLWDVNSNVVGKVLVTATSGGGFTANREYWYMQSNLSNSAEVSFVGGLSEYWSTPPRGLGTLSFTTQRTPSWTLGVSSNPMLTSYNSSTGALDGMDWEMSNSSGTWTGHITWWHDSTGNIFGPGTVTTLDPDSTSYTAYYYTTSPL